MSKIIKIFSTLAALTLLASCGKSGPQAGGSGAGGSGPDHIATEAILDGSNIEGKYLATFTTLNGHVNGTIPGSATLKRDGDRLWAFVRLFAGAPEAWHPQNIWTGSRCPTMADDLNGDGYVDIVEAAHVLGKIILPLDANINSQDALRNWYPKGDLSGNYHYEKMASFRSLFHDLKKEDRRGDEIMKKLGPDEGLHIHGRAVLIQGISPNTILPETVRGMGRFRAYQTFPIACGVFQKVNSLPGDDWSDEDEIPGPVAPVEEGQDRPAAPGEGEDAGTGATINGNSNSAETISGNTTNAGSSPRNYGENN